MTSVRLFNKFLDELNVDNKTTTLIECIRKGYNTIFESVGYSNRLFKIIKGNHPTHSENPTFVFKTTSPLSDTDTHKMLDLIGRNKLYLLAYIIGSKDETIDFFDNYILPTLNLSTRVHQQLDNMRKDPSRYYSYLNSYVNFRWNDSVIKLLLDKYDISIYLYTPITYKPYKLMEKYSDPEVVELYYNTIYEENDYNTKINFYNKLFSDEFLMDTNYVEMGKLTLEVRRGNEDNGMFEQILNHLSNVIDINTIINDNDNATIIRKELGDLFLKYKQKSLEKLSRKYESDKYTSEEYESDRAESGYAGM